MSEPKKNSNQALKLARKCKSFANKTCHEWKEDPLVKGTDWREADEMRELYFSLQVLRHNSEVALQRGSLLKE